MSASTSGGRFLSAELAYLRPAPGPADDLDQTHPVSARPVLMGTMSVMNGDVRAEVTALAINVTIPEALQWTDTRRGETFTLTTLNVRLLADGHLAVKAYGRPVGGGRGAYVSFAVPENPVLTALILREGNAPLGVGPQPDYIGKDLEAIADQLIERYVPAANVS